MFNYTSWRRPRLWALPAKPLFYHFFISGLLSAPVMALKYGFAQNQALWHLASLLPACAKTQHVPPPKGASGSGASTQEENTRGKETSAHSDHRTRRGVTVLCKPAGDGLSAAMGAHPWEPKPRAAPCCYSCPCGDWEILVSLHLKQNKEKNENFASLNNSPQKDWEGKKASTSSISSLLHSSHELDKTLRGSWNPEHVW